MTPGLTMEQLPPKRRHDLHRAYLVRFEGRRIGLIESTHIGRSSSLFFHAYVLIEDREVNIELSTDLEERAEAILAAWRDPASNVHTRYWLGLDRP